MMIDLESMFHSLQSDPAVVAHFELRFTGRIILMKNRNYLVYIDDRMVKAQKRRKLFFGRSSRIMMCECHQEQDSLLGNIERLESVLVADGLAATQPVEAQTLVMGK